MATRQITPDIIKSALGMNATGEQKKVWFDGAKNMATAKRTLDNVPGTSIAPVSQFPQVSTATLTPSSTVSGANANLAAAQQAAFGGSTKSAFDLQIKEILNNRANQANQGLMAAGKEVASGLVSLNEELGAIPGFAGLNLDQARRMASMEENGLTNLFNGIASTLEGRRTRLRELGDLAGGAFAEESQRAMDLVELKQRELENAMQMEQNQFTKELAILEMRQAYPAGTTFELDGQTYTGLGAVSSGGGGAGGGGGGSAGGGESAPLDDALAEKIARELAAGLITQADAQKMIGTAKFAQEKMSTILRRASELEAGIKKYVPTSPIQNPSQLSGATPTQSNPLAEATSTVTNKATDYLGVNPGNVIDFLLK